MAVPEPTKGQCRYPLGDPLKAGFHWCARQAAPACSYCEQHLKIVHEPQPVPRGKRPRYNIKGPRADTQAYLDGTS